MSGIEIAGIFLGAVPLVVSGLEHYAEGASTIKRIFRAPAEFRDLSRRLRVESDIFSNTLELLVKDCVDDDCLQDLLKDVGGSRWSEPEVDAALQRKLAKSYDLWLETVKAMNKAVADFRERLQLEDDGKGPFNDPNSFREARKRFQFGIRKTDYMDLVEEITKDNTALKRLTEQSLALEPARATRKRIPNFVQIRACASSMFSTLQTGLRGSCQASHRASLYMKPIESGLDGRARENEQAFRVVLHHEFKTPPQLPSRWIIEEAEVRLLDTMAAASKAPVHIRPPSACPQGKKALRWQDPQPPGPVSSSTIVPTVSQQQAPAEIKDLCESIQQMRLSACGICFGYLEDQVGAHRHGLYWPEKPLVSRQSLSSISLGSILSSNEPRSTRLSVADSRRLALSLALGVLRLHDTPWLGRQWGRDDITLFKQDNIVLAHHPFVSTDLQRATCAARSEVSPAIRNETLFALGIVLIELCMERSFDSLLLPQDLSSNGTKHTASDFLAANRLVDEVYDRAGKRYGDAVRRCVLCQFDQRKCSLEDDAFRRAVYENVVAVLEEDVAQFFGL